VNQRPAAPPTLTEVIHLSDQAMAPTEPMPLAPESLALEDVEPTAAFAVELPRAGLARGADLDARLLDCMVDALRPRLQAWLEVEMRVALTEALPMLSERMAAAFRDDLDGELRELIQRALAEARRGQVGR
jgi:hypothetical protein